MRFTGTTNGHLGLLAAILSHATIANVVDIPTATGTGNGTISYPTAENDAPTETWTLTCTATATDGGTFSVVGSVSGIQAPAYVGVAYDNGIVAFTISDGSTDFATSDTFEFGVTQLIGEDVWEAKRYRSLVDLDTAYFDTAEFDLSSQTTNPQCSRIEAEATKFYVMDPSAEEIYAYTLSEAGKVDSASYDTVLDVSAITNPQGFCFSDDGYHLYILDSIANAIYQYDLSVPWDLDYASSASKSYVFSSYITNVKEIWLATDGISLYLLNGTGDISQFVLSTPDDISTASFDSKSCTCSEIVTASGIVFDVGLTKFWVLDTSASSIYEYDLGTAGDVSTATYNEVDYSVSDAGAGPVYVQIYRSMCIDRAGSTIYLTDNYSDKVLQFSASTSWDLGTMWRDLKTLDVSGIDTYPSGFAFNDDGTQAALVANTGNCVFNMYLPVPWKIASGWVDTKVLDVSAKGSAPHAIAFNADGSKMYLAEQSSDTIYQYSLPGAGNVASAKSDHKSLDISAQTSDVSGLAFNAAGTKMYVTDPSTVYQYSLATAWDILTGTYDSVSLDLSTQTTTAQGLAIGDSGSELYIVGNSEEKVFQYTMSTPWDLSTATYSTNYYQFAVNPTGVSFSSDGYKVFVTSDDTVYKRVYEAALTTAWDISSVTGVPVTLDVSSEITSPLAGVLSADGESLYVVDESTQFIYEYSLGTADDLSTASFDVSQLDVSSLDTVPSGVAFNDDGTKMFLAGAFNSAIFQYSLSTAYDVKSATYDSVSLSVSGSFVNPYGIAFSSDGTELFTVLSGSTSSVEQYTLTTPWDLSTASYTASLSTTSQDGNISDILFSSDGLKMMLSGVTSGYVYSYDLTTAWDISTATYDSSPLDVSSYEATPRAIALSDGESSFFVAGDTEATFFELDLDTEAELILKGPGADGTDDVYVGFRTYTDTTNGQYGIYCEGYTGYEAAQTFWLQPGSLHVASPSYRPLLRLTNNNSFTYWLYISGRSIVTVARPNMRYEVGYSGLYYSNDSPQSPSTGNPYPLYVGAASLSKDTSENQGACFINGHAGEPFANAYLRYTSWISMGDHPAAGKFVAWPWNVQYDDSDLTEISPLLKPDELSLYDLMAASLVTEGKVFGQLEGIYFIPPFGVSAEDTVTVGSDTYDVFPAETLLKYCAIKR